MRGNSGSGKRRRRTAGWGVKWHTDGGPDLVENGLALCSLHHKMFDMGVIGLTGGLEVKVSRDFFGREAVGEMVLRYQGRGLVGPQAGEAVVGGEYLRWHDRNVFRGPARAKPRKGF